jgi:hypothetical protein
MTAKLAPVAAISTAAARRSEERRNRVCRQCATAGEEDVSGTIGTELSAWIVDLFSCEVVNAAEFCCAAAPAAAAQLDPPERAVGRRWLAVAVSALVMGACAGQVVVPAAETLLAPIAGIAPSYGRKRSAQCPMRRRSCGA